MFRVSAAIKCKQNKLCEEQPCFLAPLFRYFQRDAQQHFVSLQGMELRFERFGESGGFTCIEAQECGTITEDFRKAGFEIALCEKDVLNPNSMCMEDCEFLQITSARFDDQNLTVPSPPASFVTAHEWFVQTERLAAEWIAQEIASKLQEAKCDEVFAVPLELVLPAVPKYQTQNQAWFRFRLFEHSIKWIGATTCFNARFMAGLHTHKLVLTLKTTNYELQCAKERSNALLFSAAVLVPKATFALPGQPNWSELPRAVLNVVVEFLVGSKSPPKMQFKVTGAGLEAVNGTYSVLRVVESTSDNYRNLVFQRQTSNNNSREPAVFLMRSTRADCSPCGRELRWRICTKDDDGDLYLGKSSLFQTFPDAEGWESASTNAPDPAPKVERIA
ncbi:hypothetical protein BASA81_007087 [Batrachochytrium salamandrivorans]|nr:hypothetical protein BASA81_007087 [Batrachochytrium salamandrivorans]